MIRLAQVTGLAFGMEEEYRRLHDDVWPEVLEALTTAHFANYSIFVHGDQLFAYLEYHGEDLEADSARMAADPKVQEWWRHTDPCQVRPLDDGEERPWVNIEEIFHHD